MDSFNVGLDLTVTMEVRPRSLNGILFSVHGKGDFVALQLVRGEVCNVLAAYHVLSYLVGGHYGQVVRGPDL